MSFRESPERDNCPWLVVFFDVAKRKTVSKQRKLTHYYLILYQASEIQAKIRAPPRKTPGFSFKTVKNPGKNLGVAEIFARKTSLLKCQ